MPALAAPLAADKLDAWGSLDRRVEWPSETAFDDMNARHGLTEHRAYLQPTPDGNFLVLGDRRGPGADSFLANVASSGNEFDQWFMRTVADVHGMDTDGPMPPMASPASCRARLPPAEGARPSGGADRGVPAAVASDSTQAPEAGALNECSFE